jgi:hypothetical protein
VIAVSRDIALLPGVTITNTVAITFVPTLP